MIVSNLLTRSYKEMFWETITFLAYIYVYIYIIISLFMQASSLSPTQLFFVLLSLLVSTKSLSNLCRLSVTSCSKTVSFCVFAPKASLYLKLWFAKTLFPSAAAGCLAGSSYRCLQRACLQSFVSPPCATCCTHAHAWYLVILSFLL